MIRTELNISISVFFLSLLLLIGCGEPPPNKPDTVTNTGTLIISGSIQVTLDSTITPEQIGIILNDDSLGFKSNPYTLTDVKADYYNRISTYFLIGDRIVSSPEETVSILFDETEEIDFSIKVGAIIVSSSIELSPGNIVLPDNLGIILDGDTLFGYHSNPDTLSFILEGEHNVATYVRYDDKDFISEPQDVTVTLGVYSDVRIPMVSGGVLVIYAEYNQEPVATFSVKLDGVDLGVDNTPWIIRNVSAGLHYITVRSIIDDIDIEAWERDILVEISQETWVEVEMQPVSPYVLEDDSIHCPDFDCVDIDGNSYSLAEHWGKVIFIYFWSQT